MAKHNDQRDEDNKYRRLKLIGNAYTRQLRVNCL